ncbi:MAG: AraC family transcriptional regulator [Ktedonobacterales bacterium]
MPQSPGAKPRGILHTSSRDETFQLSRYLPAQDLSFFIEHYWIVSWDLQGCEPYIQETLPYPSVHLVVEQGASQVYGVQTGKFTRVLANQGRVFGMKFKPGAFYPFVRTPVSRFTNTTATLCDALHVDSAPLEDAILSRDDEGEMLVLAENFLRQLLPEHDPHVTLINDIVDWISAHREITKVDDIAVRFHLNKRAMQRLFRQYVGVSPKWVIQRFRLHEVAERLAGGDVVDWPTIVAELGYSDQAHFIKDFKAIVGQTPAAYAKSLSDP